MRAFVAVDLPQPIKVAISEQQRALRTVLSATSRYSDDLKWTRAEGIHLTLKFLGEISDKQVSLVTDALAGLGGFESFTLEVKGFGFFPDSRRPAVFWVGVQAPPGLAQLASRIETALEKLGFTAEARPFSPHLTLARFKVSKPQPELVALLEPKRELTLGRFDVSEFFLFESRLSPHGAQYRKVAQFPELSGAGT